MSCSHACCVLDDALWSWDDELSSFTKPFASCIGLQSHKLEHQLRQLGTNNNTAFIELSPVAKRRGFHATETPSMELLSAEYTNSSQSNLCTYKGDCEVVQSDTVVGYRQRELPVLRWSKHQQSNPKSLTQIGLSSSEHVLSLALAKEQ